jgi:hypothetical protein
MRNYNLNIAGYNIRFESSEDGPDIAPAERFRRNICGDCLPDVHITVNSGSHKLPKTAEKLFHAPFVEEINGVQLRHKTNFWSIWRYHSDLFIYTIFPLLESEKNATLRFSLIAREWDLWIDSDDKEVDPFEYPLDGLILYYLTVINDDIMIHASGINHKGHGYLFSGISGRGKSTMAKLWEDAGAKVIHDDRLIIRNSEKGYRMYNTPVYNNDTPRMSPLNRIFLIEHDLENRLVPIKGALAVSSIMTNCIQHNWGHDIIARLLGSVSVICTTVPVARLYFKPGQGVINLILKNEL